MLAFMNRAFIILGDSGQFVGQNELKKIGATEVFTDLYLVPPQLTAPAESPRMSRIKKR